MTYGVIILVIDPFDVSDHILEEDDWHHHIKQDNDITPAAKLGFSNVWIPEIDYLFVFAGIFTLTLSKD